jgi:hypothetical protein
VEVDTEKPMGQATGGPNRPSIAQMQPSTQKVKVPDIQSLSNIIPNKDPRGVAYCESLLIIAFALLLPQVDKNERKAKGQLFGGASEEGDPNKTYDRKSFLEYDAKPEGAGSWANRPDSVKYDMAEIQEESRVFWLLYTLIGAPQNQEYADYFGTLSPTNRNRRNVLNDLMIQPQNAIDDTPADSVLVDHTGAMRDIYLLSCMLSRNMPELWVHLSSIGFHLSSVFYGAFMRWFVFSLPLASVYRLWDLLFAESTRLVFDDKSQFVVPGLYQPVKGLRLSNAKKPARHVLIDLAYAVLKACTTKLMTTSSASEARDCMVNYMEGLYDPSTVIEIIADAEKDLWETLLSEHLNRMPLFLNDFAQTEEFYQKAYIMTWVQNQVLQGLKTNMKIDTERGRHPQGMSNMPQQMQGRQLGDQRMTTKNLITYVIVPLQRQLLQSGSKQYGGMWRPLPKHVYESGPQLNRSMKDRVMHFFAQASDAIGIHTEDMMRVRPIPMPALPGNLGEPTSFDQNAFQRLMAQALGHEWQAHCDEIFRSFYKPSFSKTGQVEDEDESRLSLTELFVALIVCSKGTIGEKILALFRVYAHNEKQWKMHHHIPVLHHAKAVVDKVEGSAERERKM